MKQALDPKDLEHVSGGNVQSKTIYLCRYCDEAFDSKKDRDEHEAECPHNPANTSTRFPP